MRWSIRGVATTAVVLAAVGARAEAETTGAVPPPPASTVEDGPDFMGDGLVPLIAGGVSGLVLAGSLVPPSVAISPYGDTATVTLSIAAGIAAAFIANATKHTRYPGRLRVTIGSSTAHYVETGVAYRATVAPQLAIEAAVLVANDSYSETERQTRCTFFGCVTGDYIVDSRDEQMGAAVLRAVYEPLPASRFRPSISIGGGPSHARAKLYGSVMEERTGAVLDGMVGIEPGWLTADLGVRVGAVDTRSGTVTALYFRLGYVFGTP